jgi:hypothetical protein
MPLATDDIALEQVWIHRREARRVQVTAYTGKGRNGFVTVVGLASGRHSSMAESDFRMHYAIDSEPAGGMLDVQLALDLGDLVEPVYLPEMTLAERFRAFHGANPWVYRAYERLAADWVARGNTRIGVKMLTEIIRWQYGRETTGRAFRIDNSFTSRYARMLVDRNPGWDGLFETRKLRTDT